MIVRLETTLRQFEDLHASITARGKSVAVPISTLNALLVDHSRMVRTLEGLGVTVQDRDDDQHIKARSSKAR